MPKANLVRKKRLKNDIFIIEIHTAVHIAIVWLK